MKRNKIIIISIIGIVIIVLTLLGLTYAYFVTQIEGNNSDKSVEVTTANLLLTYSDGNGTITANNIMPGTTTEEKIFTVKNNGNQVVGNYKVYLESVINTFINTSDVVINMSCESNKEEKTCLGLIDTIFPTTNDVLVSNSIDVGETQTYSLTVTYKETGIDQSIDMGKTFSGKIQIYDAKNIVDISGTVSDSADGDYVELHSTPKISQINNKKVYKITGVGPGEHTFYIKNKEGNIKGSKTIIINKSNFISHTDTTINITSNTNDVKINVTDIKENLGIEIDNIIENPYNDDSHTLAYNIINNAQLNKNRTTYEPNPITTPGKEINKIYSYEKKYFESKYKTASYTILTTHHNYYWTYADSFAYDEITGKFSLVNPHTCKYSECYQNLSGKYSVSYSPYMNISLTNTIRNSSDLDYIYKINTTTLSTIDFFRISNIPDSAERTISKTEDDYGDTYYFRGDIKDNYLNFNGMCWRIVRIEGDGAIKLILDDKNTVCNNETYTGEYAYSNTIFGTKKVTLVDNTIINENNFLNYSNGLYDKLKDFQNYEMSDVLDKLKPDEWCYDNRAYSDSNGTTSITNLDTFYQNNTNFYYSGYKRIYINNIPSFKCSGTKLTKYRDKTTVMYTGTITADELTFAGAKYDSRNYNFYLMNNCSINRAWTFTLSPMVFQDSSDYIAILGTDGGLSKAYVSNGLSIRPSVTLKVGTKIIKGDGTQSNPYEIE